MPEVMKQCWDCKEFVPESEYFRKNHSCMSCNNKHNAEKIKCKCGIMIRRGNSNSKSHLQSKQHQQYERSINVPKNNIMSALFG